MEDASLFWSARIRKDLPFIVGPTNDTSEGCWLRLSLGGRRGKARSPNCNRFFDTLNSMKQFDLSSLNVLSGMEPCSLGSLRKYNV